MVIAYSRALSYGDGVDKLRRAYAYSLVIRAQVLQ
jgi:hypothetical protein